MADQGDETTATDPENATAETAAQQPQEPGRDWKAGVIGQKVCPTSGRLRR